MSIDKSATPLGSGATFRDRNGLVFTASSPESIDAFEAVTVAYLGSTSDVMTLLDQLIAADPAMLMARCFRVCLLKLAANPAVAEAIDAGIADLDASRVTSREQLHIAAADAWRRNQTRQASLIYESILRTWPHDIIALRAAHHMHFYAGDSSEMRASVARVIDAWSDDDPLVGYVYGMYAFGLEEAGAYDEAQTFGERALAHNAKDIWATHAVAHVYQMQSKYQSGIDWLQTHFDQWADVGNFRFHLHWHHALLHLGNDDAGSALSIYDEWLIDPIGDDFYLDVCNAASLLWRLHMAGIDVSDRWRALQDISAARSRDQELVFTAIHFLMAPAALRDQPVVERALASFEQWSARTDTQAEVCRQVGLPLARALIDLGRGNAPAAAATLSAIETDLYRIGGSHTQRALFTELADFHRSSPS